MILLSDLLGQDAIALGSAAKTGSVKGVVLDGHRVVAVDLGDHAIPASAVRSFEGDVLTYDETIELADATPARIDPRGARLLDMNGDLVGTISDLAIAADGELESIVLSDGEAVLGARLRVIGSYAAVLSVDLPPPTGAPVA